MMTFDKKFNGTNKEKRFNSTTRNRFKTMTPKRTPAKFGQVHVPAFGSPDRFCLGWSWLDFVVPVKRKQSIEEPWRNASVFGIRALCNEYMTTIIYTNRGSCEVRKVSVNVELKINETVSHTLV